MHSSHPQRGWQRTMSLRGHTDVVSDASCTTFLTRRHYASSLTLLDFSFLVHRAGTIPISTAPQGLLNMDIKGLLGAAANTLGGPEVLLPHFTEETPDSERQMICQSSGCLATGSAGVRPWVLASPSALPATPGASSLRVPGAWSYHCYREGMSLVASGNVSTDGALRRLCVYHCSSRS